MKRLLLCFFISLTCSYSASAADDSVDFLPEDWSPGLHLLAGGGFNSALYVSDSESLSMGLGVNIKTDVGYYLNKNWAIELGSSVKFNKLRDNVVWNTLFTLGIRYRLGRITFLPPNNLYGRLFYGRAPTVVFYEEEIPNSNPGDDDDEKTTRIQFDGPVYGVSLGSFMRTEGGWVYFVELTGSAQHLEQEDKINMNGQVPVVVSSNRVKDESMIYAFHLNFGIMLF